MKHTPGPWSASSHGIIGGARTVAIEKPDNKPWGDAVADVRLIAAAPELLGVGKSCEDFSKDVDLF